MTVRSPVQPNYRDWRRLGALAYRSGIDGFIAQHHMIFISYLIYIRYSLNTPSGSDLLTSSCRKMRLKPLKSLRRAQNCTPLTSPDHPAAAESSSNVKPPANVMSSKVLEPSKLRRSIDFATPAGRSPDVAVGRSLGCAPFIGQSARAGRAQERSRPFAGQPRERRLRRPVPSTPLPRFPLKSPRPPPGPVPPTFRASPIPLRLSFPQLAPSAVPRRRFSAAEHGHRAGTVGTSWT